MARTLKKDEQHQHTLCLSSSQVVSTWEHLRLQQATVTISRTTNPLPTPRSLDATTRFRTFKPLSPPHTRTEHHRPSHIRTLNTSRPLRPNATTQQIYTLRRHLTGRRPIQSTPPRSTPAQRRSFRLSSWASHRSPPRSAPTPRLHHTQQLTTNTRSTRQKLSTTPSRRTVLHRVIGNGAQEPASDFLKTL